MVSLPSGPQSPTQASDGAVERGPEVRTAQPAERGRAARTDEAAQGHWLLARLGKRVLRPGGVELTRWLLGAADLAGADVVELAPGLGHTASAIVATGPRSYTGVDQEASAVAAVAPLVAGHGTVQVGDAAATGLPDASADVVLGEAMLTMQGAQTKDAIVAEAARLLRPGGRYAIHELGLMPDTLPDAVKTEIRQSMARALHVNARPLTLAEWRELLVRHGLVVAEVMTAPMALLQPRRLVADEGVRGALRFARNLLLRPAARRRVLTMRRTFRTHREHLVAVALIAQRPQAGDDTAPSGDATSSQPLTTDPATGGPADATSSQPLTTDPATGGPADATSSQPRMTGTAGGSAHATTTTDPSTTHPER